MITLSCEFFLEAILNKWLSSFFGLCKMLWAATRGVLQIERFPFSKSASALSVMRTDWFLFLNVFGAKDKLLCYPFPSTFVYELCLSFT